MANEIGTRRCYCKHKEEGEVGEEGEEEGNRLKRGDESKGRR